jgi:hypothetical protein
VRRWPPVYAFVLWETARDQEARILTDLSRTFRVLGLVEVTWTPDHTFARSLTRMYGDALPPGSDKEQHGGTGPFMLVVVEDRRPRLRPRHTARGRRLVNARVYDARLRYREWTGGGYRVHASDSVTETQRNLVLLLGEGVDAIRRTGTAPARRAVGDAAGTHGWASREQLLTALAAYGAVPSGPQTDQCVTVLASDVWWAEHVAGGTEVRPGARQVSVAGSSLEVVIRERPRRPVRALRAVTGAVRSR